MSDPDTPGFRPLYRQVREVLARRIADGTWPPGAMLPSEIALAAELKVSQGTVRKALDSLAADKVVERRQGRGTHVAEVTPEASLFRFFRIAAKGGARKMPASGPARVRRRSAKEGERRRIALGQGAEVFEISRVRAVDGAPAIVERIVVPAARFPDLDKRSLPNALYALYQSAWGVSIMAADEEVQAVAATADIAAALGLEPGAPVLFIDRIARELDGTPVEWRRSHCDTRHACYAVTLR